MAMIEFRRRYASSLTDDELILLDPMFDSPHRPRAFYHSNYQDLFNTPYCHCLSDSDVEAALVRLCGAGVVGYSNGRYALTADGGRLWEAERDPPWPMYCYEAEGHQDGGRLWDVEIVAVSREVGEQFLCTAQRYGRYPDVSMASLNWSPMERSPIYWKQDLAAWHTRFPSQAGDQWDHDGFFNAMQWWSSLTDLNRYLPPSPSGAL
jgi:hypothetical protein